MTVRLDTVLLLLWLALLGFGVVMVASASLSDAQSADPWRQLTRHGVFLALALFTFAVVVALPLDFWRVLHRPALFVAVALLVAVLIPGIGNEVNGARRWIGIGPASAQASEVAKFLFIVYLAGYVTRFRDRLAVDFSALLIPIAAFGLCGALLIAEPDFGTVVVLALVTAALTFLAGTRLRYLLIVGAVGVAALALVALAEPYRFVRISVFLDPWASAFGSGYQLTQSLIAFGRGELWGLGLGDSVQKLAYLPEAHNDFIFAVVAEELGLVGALVVVAVFCWLCLRMFRVARRCALRERHFAASLCYGAGVVIATQFLINVGVASGVLPTKGLTLPFVSFGGNSLVVCSALLALVVRADAELADV